MAMPPKAKKQKKPKAFIRDELDRTVLTEEEKEDLENNYTVSCTTYTRFQPFCSSDSDSSPTYDENEAIRPEVHRQVQLNHRSGSNNSLGYTIAELVKIGPPSAWNKTKSSHAYKAFKVNTYIVDPNYLLCTSLNGDEHLSRVTMDVLLEEIGGKFMPSWQSVKDKLLYLLDIYNGCEELPNSIIDPVDPTAYINKFLSNLSDASARRPSLFKDDPQYEMALRLTLSMFTSFGEDLLKYLDKEEGGGSERLVQLYTTTLLTHFFSCAKIPMLSLARQRMFMHLGISLSRDLLPVTLEPDLQIYIMNKLILVGEVKACGCHGRKMEREKHRGHRVKEGQSSEENGDGDVHKESCGEASIETHALQKVNSKRRNQQLSQEEVMRLKERHRVSVEAKSGGGDGNVQRKRYMDAGEGSSDGAGVQKQRKIESETPANGSQANTKKKFQPYRDLDPIEEYKVADFLPQLLGGILAFMTPNSDKLGLGAINENVRFGFSVEGFKLRFVRLVLCADRTLRKKPTVADIGDQRVRCEVFLTQELNLFKKKHIIMLFQLLLGISYVHVRDSG